jgi:glycosyltransferase involved in cell wall biosynthesis
LLVSVIIPCYNQGAFIQDAIDSVIAQKYKNWEIIIVDDGSTDEGTIEKLKEINNISVAIYFQQNKGVSAARNLGASKAQGEFLLFLDGDDKIEKEYLQLAINAFCLNDKLNYVYCDLQEFGETNNYRSLELLNIKKILLYNQTHVSAILKKSLWIASNGFDESFKKGWEDWDFIIRVLKLNIVFYKIPKAMLLYRILKKSRDKTAVEIYNKDLQNQIYRKHLESYLVYYDEPISVLRNFEIQQGEILQLHQKLINIYNTYSYKLGSVILFPFKFLKRIFIDKER